MNSGYDFLGKGRVRVRVRETLGAVEDLHDEGNRDGVSNVDGIGDVGVGSTAGEDTADAAKSVGDARPRDPFSGERAH